MYMILWWLDEDNYMSCVHNEDGSIRLWDTLAEADAYANEHRASESMRVISIEAAEQ